MEDDTTINEQKIRESFNSNLKLHLLKLNGEWRNGYVKEVASNFFIFEDAVNGKEALFFFELKKVEPYMREE